MGRIQDAVVVGARTVRRMPLPRPLYTHTVREARRPLPPGAVQKRHAIDTEMVGRTRCLWLDRHRADEGVIVHLHSGAYVSGPFSGDWAWLSAQADARGCAGLMIDYRVAPDHQHPVALDDTEAVLAQLAEQGVLAGGWILAGHNAGAGMALAIARRLRDGEGALAGVPAPDLIVAMSPWLDLELGTTGISETGQRDFPHERRLLLHAARAYAGRTPLSDPDLSPVNAPLAGLPPVHLSVGEKDIFLSDARVARLQLEEAGLPITYREIPGRLTMMPGMRRGESMGRLLREQSAAIADALARD
ncbi:alpha/beta hydrolase [Brachybacterium sp. JHP9]|uniref:Alpha/beta hydrolase n=1 Tax=Brachybacterium equifaecis TaxID=2910770 RepID=A0ABT0QY50_9MICO|nr:alpha/beta hydrolase fold domain-containing protein [Brachybacterium equifaecis]MCL6422579.1 alpha/beta hydrolase [Brachybacterium equifaecis]